MADEHHHHDHHHGPGLRFCPRCGDRLERKRVKANEPERRVCRGCGFIFYDDPKIAACTIPVIDEKIVLLKRGIEPSYGKWVFPGGFMDVGETAEAAAARETREEANLEVDELSLLGVYTRTHAGVVVIVYEARALGEGSAGSETSEIGWFAPDAIPWDELAFDTTHWALEAWLKRRGLSR